MSFNQQDIDELKAVLNLNDAVTEEKATADGYVPPEAFVPDHYSHDHVVRLCNQACKEGKLERIKVRRNRVSGASTHWYRVKR